MNIKYFIAMLMLIALTATGCKTTDTKTISSSTISMPGVFSYTETTEECPTGHVSNGHCYFQLRNPKNNNTAAKASSGI